MGNERHSDAMIRSSAAEYLTFIAATGDSGVEALYAEEDIWLSQKMMGELYNVNVRTISEHLINIFSDNELQEEAVVRKFRITARETGAVDNSACRDFCGVDTLAASSVLRGLRDKGILIKQGTGKSTHYVLSNSTRRKPVELSNTIDIRASPLSEDIDPSSKVATLVATLPPELATLLATLGKRSGSKLLQNSILRLCAWMPLSVDQLATLLDRSPDYLRNKHLAPLVRAQKLKFLHPESANHPFQAYKTSEDVAARLHHDIGQDT